jgi:hypothetical protein
VRRRLARLRALPTYMGTPAASFQI